LQDPQPKPGFKPWRVFAGMSAGVALGFAAIGLYAWREFADVDLGPDGYLAFVLGAAGTAAVAIGLMVLLFFSAHRGHDEDIGKPGKRRGS
jgi:hypothetical protein